MPIVSAVLNSNDSVSDPSVRVDNLGNDCSGSVHSNVKNGFIKCLSLNARSLKNKFAELHELLYNDSCRYDIISVCESWLTSNSVSDGMLDPNSEYTIMRADRVTATTGGGVCVFISKHLNVIPIDIRTKFPLLECVSFDLIDV